MVITFLRSCWNIQQSSWTPWSILSRHS